LMQASISANPERNRHGQRSRPRPASSRSWPSLFPIACQRRV